MKKATVLCLLKVVVDVAVIVMVTISAIMMFVYGGEALSSTGIEFLKYFTVQSNLLAGALMIIALPFDLLLLFGRRDSIPLGIKLLPFISSIGTSLTMLTVLVYLGPTMGYPFMFTGANLFMHLLTPLGMIVRTMILEEKEPRLSFSHSFLGIAHMTLYGIYYLTNIAVNNGYGTTQYDWYGFGAGGIGVGIAVYFVMILMTYGISWLTYFLQKRICLFPQE